MSDRTRPGSPNGQAVPIRGETTNNTEVENGFVRPPPPIQPPMSERQDSTHVHALARSAENANVDPIAAYPKAPASLNTSFASSSQHDGDSDSAQRVDDLDAAIATKPMLDQLYATHPLPATQRDERWLKFRHVTFSTYVRLYVLVILVNLVAIIVMITRATKSADGFKYSSAADAVAANLFAATMARHEHFVNLIFRVCVAVPHWAPVSVRRLAAKVYAYGGLHASCGISAALWYIFFAVLLLSRFNNGDTTSKILGVLTGFLLFLLVMMIGLSHPSIRARLHDIWEISHRFGGWSAVALVWAQLWVIFAAEAKSLDTHVGKIALVSPAFWFLCAITLMIIYPWLRLRRVKVETDRLSSHAAILRFPNHRRRVAPCVGIRLSEMPMLENHGFATIADPNGEQGYTVLVSNAGDFTNDIINNPREHLWIRGARTIGVMRVAQLFKPVIVVATGSGIGPCMSFLRTHPQWPVRIIWSTRMPQTRYCASLVRELIGYDQNSMIVDSAKTGRPDLLALTYALYAEAQAEAVVIISNPNVTNEVVYGLEKRGIPAFGAIFDS